jgi:DNA-binding PadR family transcriptional regulator
MLGDATGYEIRKLYEDGPFSAIHHASFGSIYPALNRLLTDGLVTVVEEEQTGRPDRKVYSLTSAGRDAFVRALHSDPAPDKHRSDMLFILTFGHLVDPLRRRALLDAYLEEHRSRLAELRSCEDDGPEPTPGERFIHGFGEAIYDCVVRYIEENRHLLEGTER